MVDPATMPSDWATPTVLVASAVPWLRADW